MCKNPFNISSMNSAGECKLITFWLGFPLKKGSCSCPTSCLQCFYTWVIPARCPLSSTSRFLLIMHQMEIPPEHVFIHMSRAVWKKDWQESSIPFCALNPFFVARGLPWSELCYNSSNYVACLSWQVYYNMTENHCAEPRPLPWMGKLLSHFCSICGWMDWLIAMDDD